MTTVLNILALIAAMVVPFWVGLYLYGRIQKSMKKDAHAPGAEPLNSGEDHASGGDGGHSGDGGSH